MESINETKVEEKYSALFDFVQSVKFSNEVLQTDIICREFADRIIDYNRTESLTDERILITSLSY